MTEKQEIGNEKDYATAPQSKRRQRKSALLWRMFDQVRATREHVAKVKRDAKQPLNLDNKPLGAKE